MTPKFPFVDNMRQYGGNFVSKLADAMVAADPENFKILVEAFPQIVEKYTEPVEVISKEDLVRMKIDEFMPELLRLNCQISTIDVEWAWLCRSVVPLRREERRLRSRLYIVQNNITKEQVHFSGSDANDDDWMGTVGRFVDRLKSVPVETRKRFAEWNGLIYFTSELIEGNFSPTPAMTAELEA